MNYVTFGRKSNPAVVFLHGWGGNIDSWKAVAKTISGFGFYCVVLDFAGFGKTPEPLRVYSIFDYADDVEMLINGLSLNNVTLVGHSFGGRVAIVLGSKNLSAVDKIVLVDSAGVMPRRGIKYRFKIFQYKKVKKKVAAGKVDSGRLAKFGSADYKILSPVMKASFVQIVNTDLLPYAKNINKQTLLVWGRRDKDTPLYMAKKLNRAIKGARISVYDGGHYSYLDYFNRFIDELYEFLVY